MPFWVDYRNNFSIHETLAKKKEKQKLKIKIISISYFKYIKIFLHFKSLIYTLLFYYARIYIFKDNVVPLQN